MTEFETQALLYLARIAKAVEGGGGTGNSAPRPAASGARFGNYGQNKGGAVVGASERDLRYYGGGCLKSLGDESKQRFHATERTLLDAIVAEMKSRGMDASDFEDDRGPPPRDRSESGPESDPPF